MISNPKYWIKGLLAQKPDFFIAGFQKCGTTSLYEWLFGSSSLTKGEEKENDTLAFSPDKLLKYLSRFPRARAGVRTGCASHQIGYVPHGPETLARYFPGARVIFVVRNPIQRAVSRYDHNQRKALGGSTFDPMFKQTFEELVSDELDYYRGFGAGITTTDIYEFGKRYSAFGLPVGRGIFLPYINAFKKAGFKVLITSVELLQRQTEQELDVICQFLDIEKPLQVGGIHNQNPNKPKSLPTGLFTELEEFYGPFNDSLLNLEGRDLKLGVSD